MPFHAPPVTTERAALAAFLKQQQDAVRAVAFGLTDAEAAATPTASTLSVGVLVQHTASCQQGWLDSVLAAPAQHVDPRPAGEQYAAYQAEFAFTPGASLADALARYDAVCAAVQQAVLSTDLDTPVPVPDAPWNPRDVESWNVRWVWFHLVEELARHAGHGDIVREAVDGATMYELVAAAEGMPATDWLTPWSPPGQRAE